LFDVGLNSNWLNKISEVNDFENIIFINFLVSLSVALLFQQLRWNALRVVVTVIVALLLGYFITFLFNLDSTEK